MNRTNFFSRAVILGLVLVAALVTASCDNGYGMGVGMDYGARWGGGASGPTVMVGGPSR